MMENNRSNWPAVLQDVVENYNNTFHRTIKQKPMDVWTGEALNHQAVVMLPTYLKKGNIMHYILKQHKFTKGDEDYYSKSFVITRRAFEGGVKGENLATQ